MEIDDDEVFSSGTPGGIAGSRKAGRSESSARKSTAEDPKARQMVSGEEEARSHRKRAHSSSLAGGGNPTNQSTNDPKGSCSHHQSLLGQLSSIIQVLALQCPTAFITITINKGVGRDIMPRASTSLDKLPLPLAELPATKRIQGEEQRKVCCLRVCVHAGRACGSFIY